MNKLRQRKAFTIVEMVIVIAVIAILAAVLIPTISGVIQQANVSADTQFAASLNVQLAMWEVDNGSIDSESDLRDAINDYYGDNFYETLTPKSGKYGYSYWYDVENKQVVLSTYEKLLEAAAEPAALAEGEGGEGGNIPAIKFSSSSLRSGLVEGFFFMDHSDSSEIAGLISTLETLADPEEYKTIITETLPALTADEDFADVAAAIEAKLERTTIITDAGAFRYDDLANIEYVWIPVATTKLQQLQFYVYNGTDVSDAKTGLELAGETVTDIELPSGVTVSLGGLPAIKTDNYNDTDLNRDYSGTTKLHVNVKEVKDLAKIYTDCVLVMPNGAKYIYLGENFYALPVTINPATNLPTNAPAGTVDNSTMSIDSFSIDCKEAATSNPGEDKVYLDGTTLYVAYDKGGVNLSLTDGVTNGMVTWVSDNEALATVNGDGKVEFKSLPGTKADADYNVEITATYKYSAPENPVKATITIEIVRPVSVDFKIGESPVNLLNDTDKGAISITYTGDNQVLDISDITATELNQTGFVAVEAGVLSFDPTSCDLFTIANNKLTINTDNLNGTGEQDVTITYTGNSGTVYLTKTYTVEIIDNSGSSVQVNKITDTVNMGTYLFRVGNSNTFKLGKLFGAVDPTKKVTVEDVKIYDASKTYYESDGTPVYTKLTTSGNFNVTYTADATNWENSTIKFGGTGVAIIKVETSKGFAELAVEVVDGYNVTAVSELKTNANNILLNDIKLASGGSIQFSGNDANNHIVLYGNGFTFDITEGRITNNSIIVLNNADLDNVRIIGKVYSTFADSYSKDYYSSAVYIGGNARISNCYIFGTRSNIFVNGDVEIIDTVLDTARYANINHENGTLTINGLTTMNEPREANGNVAGLGIVYGDGATSACKIVLKGDLIQHNWICEDDQAKMPSVTGLRTFINTIFENTQYLHKINNVNYANLGIISMTDDVSMSNIAHPTHYSGTTISKAGYTGFAISITDASYDATANDLIYRNQAYNWEPTKQANTVPTIKWTNHSSGSADVTFEKGSSGEFDPNVFSATKYGSMLTHTITVNGVDYTGKKITFTDSQTCTIVYTVKDSKVYDNKGASTGVTVNYEYTLVVNVTATNPKIKDTEFTFASSTGTTKVEYNGKTYMVPTFTDSSKFYNVGNGIYAPIVEVQFMDNTSDFTPYYPIFGGVSITWYNSSNVATTYNSSSNLSAMPSGLEWITNISSVKGTEAGADPSTSWDGYAKYPSAGGLCRKGKADGSTNSNDSYKTVEFSFQAEGGEKYYYYIRFKEPAHDCPSGGCFTPDTLITLADGTQKRVDELLPTDTIMAWDFFTGEYVEKKISLLVNHGEDLYKVAKLEFSDGTELKLIDEHGVFDYDLNKYVYFTAENYADYIGHNFVKQNLNGGYDLVQLVGGSVTEEYTSAWSVSSAETSNAFASGMLTVAPPEDFYNWIEMSGKLQYNVEQFAADVEKYGLYTYEDFADYVTPEQFVEWNGAYLKIAVEKGYFTFDYILELIEMYKGWMP